MGDERGADERDAGAEGRIDRAFRARRGILDGEERVLATKRAEGDARIALLSGVRRQVVDPALDRIAAAFLRNGCPAEPGTPDEDGDTRSRRERRFTVPAAPGRPETMTVAAAVVLSDPAGGALRVTVQVAERREQSDAFAAAAFRTAGDRDAAVETLRGWCDDALERLVVDRLDRRGL